MVIQTKRERDAGKVGTRSSKFSNRMIYQVSQGNSRYQTNPSEVSATTGTQKGLSSLGVDLENGSESRILCHAEVTGLFMNCLGILQ